MMTMKAIYKFGVTPTDGPQPIVGPGKPRPLYFGMQDGLPFVWAEVTPGQPEEATNVYMVGTGHSYYPSLKYVGTTFNGPFVWHLLVE